VDSNPNPCYNRAWIEGTNVMIVDSIAKFNPIKVGDLVRISDDNAGWVMGYVEEKSNRVHKANSHLKSRSYTCEIDYLLRIIPTCKSEHWVYGEANDNTYTVLIKINDTVETEFLAEIL